MDASNLDQVFAALGRPEYVSGIDNETLDFSQLEAFIECGDVPSGYFTTTLGGTEPPITHRTTPGHHLPESPPDSGSEHPYSPPDTKIAQPSNINHNDLQNGMIIVTPIQDSRQVHMTVSPDHLNRIMQQTQIYTELKPPHLNHHNLIHSFMEQPNTMMDGRNLMYDSMVQGRQDLGQMQVELSTQLDNNTSIVSPIVNHQQINNVNQLNLASPTECNNIPTQVYTNVQPAAAQPSKKRKLSQDIVPHVKCEPSTEESAPRSHQPAPHILVTQGGVLPTGEASSDQSGDPAYQCIRFQPFQQSNWHALCDQALKPLPPPHYRVDADKGFNFSNSDEAFVCQKKNHFQVTCHAQLRGDAHFVKTPDGFKKITSFHLHFYGVKVEAPNQTIKVEQSQSDRSKKPFHPVLIELHSGQVTKVTVGRLHFSETTCNNMRKKGKPNPDQRHFQLVVGLHAHTHDQHYPVASHASERIIVRASNPGQFESDVDLCWQRGTTPDSIFHNGRIGINTDRPDESCVIHGNLKITGHIVQPSDARAKQDIQECDTAQQLRNVQNIRVVRYSYHPEFANHSGLTEDVTSPCVHTDTGVIAQEVRQVIPEAVKEAGDVVLPNGDTIHKLLVVNKDRIFMENVGAVKELCKVTGHLESRIDQLEKINRRLCKISSLQRRDSTCTESRFSIATNYSGRSMNNEGSLPGPFCDIANIPVPYQTCCQKHKCNKNKHSCGDKAFSKYGNFYNANKMNACVKYYTAKHHSLTKEIYDHHHRTHQCGGSPKKMRNVNKDRECDLSKFSMRLGQKAEDNVHSGNDCSVSMMTIMKDAEMGEEKQSSSSSSSTLGSCSWTVGDLYRGEKRCCSRTGSDYSSKLICSNKFIIVTIGLLAVIMAICLLAILGLYIDEHNNRIHMEKMNAHANPANVHLRQNQINNRKIPETNPVYRQEYNPKRLKNKPPDWETDHVTQPNPPYDRINNDHLYNAHLSNFEDYEEKSNGLKQRFSGRIGEEEKLDAKKEQRITTEMSNFIDFFKTSLNAHIESLKPSKLPFVTKNLWSQKDNPTTEPINAKSHDGSSQDIYFKSKNKHINLQREDKSQSKLELGDNIEIQSKDFSSDTLNYLPTNFGGDDITDSIQEKTVDTIGRPSICSGVDQPNIDSVTNLENCQIYCCLESPLASDGVDRESDINEDIETLGKHIKDENIGNMSLLKEESHILPKEGLEKSERFLLHSSIDKVDQSDDANSDSKELNNVLPSTSPDDKTTKNKLSSSGRVNTSSSSKYINQTDTSAREQSNKKDVELEVERNMLPKFNLTFLNENGAKKFAQNSSKTSQSNISTSESILKKNSSKQIVNPPLQGNFNVTSEKRVRRQTVDTKLGREPADIQAFLDDTCATVDLTITGQEFNETIGKDIICHNTLNITYHIPLSKYMPDRFLYLTFTSQNIKALSHCKIYNEVQLKHEDCPYKNENIYQENSERKPVTLKKTEINKNEQSHKMNESQYEIDLSGVMEETLVFKASQSSHGRLNVCDTTSTPSNKIIQYNIHIYRNCKI